MANISLLAVLQLKDPIQLNHPDKARLCLPDEKQPTADNTECTIVGWGHTQWNGTQPDELREAKVLTVPNNVCNLPVAYNGTINSNHTICAGFEKGGIDACNFDSGGSMISKKGGKYLVYYYPTFILLVNELSKPNRLLR